MNKRVEDLKKLGRTEVEALAERMGVKPEKTVIGTAKAIEKREFTDRRNATKIPMIKDIF